MLFPLPGMSFPTHTLSDQLYNVDSSSVSQLRFYFLGESLPDTLLHLPELGAPLKFCHCSENISPQKHLLLCLVRARCMSLVFTLACDFIENNEQGCFACLAQSMTMVGSDLLNRIITERLRNTTQEFASLFRMLGSSFSDTFLSGH